jgi:hypothetical protein
MASKEALSRGVGKPKSVGTKFQYTLGEGAKSGLPKGATDGGLFTVLGIETSCDDTGAAVVRSDGLILGEALASQHEVSTVGSVGKGSPHKPYSPIFDDLFYVGAA